MANRSESFSTGPPVHPRRPRPFLVVSILTVALASPAGAARLTNKDFEQLVLTLSESPGYFNTDNLISNESSYLQVFPRLREIAKPGRAYIGVGPDQNFTYIVQVRPAFAIIVDLRRDNLLLHLFLKQLVEVCETRWQYLSYLFGKPLPEDFRPFSWADAAALARHFQTFPSSYTYFEENFERTWNIVRNRFPQLTREEDGANVYQMARAFFEENLGLKYRSHGRLPRSYYPSYEQLMTERDRSNQMGHYLNSEKDFQFLKRIHTENRIVPVIGDLAGTEALKKIGAYLKKRGHIVSALYTSNVEFYVFRQGTFLNFTENLNSLPLDSHSVLIRSYFNYWREHPETVPGYYVTSLLQYLQNFLKLHQEKPYVTYWELVTRDFESAAAVDQP